MKNIIYICLLMSTAFFWGCYEQENPIEELYETDGREYPVISEWFIMDDIASDSVVAGQVFNVDLRYWSSQEISEIRFSQMVNDEETVLDSRPYQQNFNEDTQTDQMIFEYTVPADLAEGTEIILHAEVVNANGLTRKTGDGSRSGTRSPVSIIVRN